MTDAGASDVLQQQQQPPPAASSAAIAGGQQAAAQLPAAAAAGQQFISYHDEVQAGFRQLRALFAAMDVGQGEPDFETVRGWPGIVMEPMPWSRLVLLVADGGERALGTLGRHPLGIKRYWDRRDMVLLRQYTSVTDYLLLDIFGFEHELEPDGRKRAVVPPGFFQTGGSSGGSGDQGEGGGAVAIGRGTEEGFRLVTKWRQNDFPYNLEPGIAHLNLWANRPLSGEEVEAHIAQRVPHDAEVTWFVNPPTVQSVPAIWHAHILFRRQQQGQ